MKRLFQQRWRFRWFRRIAPWIAGLVPPCPEIARLASESCDRPLAWRERWRMRMHYLICDWCRRYASQVRLLHAWAPRLHDHAPHLERRAMPLAAKQRLKERFRVGGHSQSNPGPQS